MVANRPQGGHPVTVPHCSVDTGLEVMWVTAVWAESGCFVCKTDCASLAVMQMQDTAHLDSLTLQNSFCVGQRTECVHAGIYVIEEHGGVTLRRQIIETARNIQGNFYFLVRLQKADSDGTYSLTESILHN